MPRAGSAAMGDTREQGTRSKDLYFEFLVKQTTPRSSSCLAKMYVNICMYTPYMQGTFIKRHVFLKDDGVSSFTPQDFAVGECVSIYGRTFFLVDADPFTRQWYEDNMSTTLQPALPYPDDPVDQYRSTFGLTKGAKGVCVWGTAPAALEPALQEYS
eukprot:534328-Pelagomonas_calceolata.AAC.3